MEFPPDIGFVIQIVSFLVLWVVLKRWLFDPTLRVLEMRRERTTGQLAEAERLQREAAKMRADYEAALTAARAAAREEMAAVRSQTEEQEKRILESARAEAADIIQGVRSAVAAEMQAARGTVARYAGDIAREAAEKILGRRLQ